MAHRRHRESERGATSEPVADMADQAPPTGRIRKPTAKMPKADSTCATGSSLRKEHATDRGGEVAVDREVVPFEHVADRAGRDDPEERCHPERSEGPFLRR